MRPWHLLPETGVGVRLSCMRRWDSPALPLSSCLHSGSLLPFSGCLFSHPQGRVVVFLCKCQSYLGWLMTQLAQD